MEFFCWFSCSSGCCPRRKESTLNLGLKKGAWILCIAEGKALLSSLASWACWACCVLAGLAGCDGWAAGCGLGLLAALACCLSLIIFFCFSFVSFQLVCCYPLSFFFFFYSTGSFQATLFPLNSRLARELFWSLNPVVWLERIIWALWAPVACGPLISSLFILFSP
jgi:hypothetical protein